MKACAIHAAAAVGADVMDWNIVALTKVTYKQGILNAQFKGVIRLDSFTSIWYSSTDSGPTRRKYGIGYHSRWQDRGFE